LDIKEPSNEDEVRDANEEDSIGIDLKEGIIEEDEKKASRPKVIRAMKNLQGWINPEATDMIDASISGRKMIIDQANFAVMVSDHPKESATFKEA